MKLFLGAALYRSPDVKMFRQYSANSFTMKIRSLTKNILQVTSVEAENAALIDTRARAFQSEEINFLTSDKKSI